MESGAIDISGYVVYHITEVPFGVFGRSCVFVAYENSKLPGKNKIFHEVYILTQCPEESMIQNQWELHSYKFQQYRDALSETRDELLGIEDFLIDKGKRQAEIMIFDLLKKRANDFGRPEIELFDFKLEECPAVRWMSGMFQDQFKEIEKNTKCIKLSNHLKVINRIL